MTQPRAALLAAASLFLLAAGPALADPALDRVKAAGTLRVGVEGTYPPFTFQLAAEVSAVLRRLAAEGVTMVMATHDLRLASSIARDVVFLEGGRVVESGPAAQVFGAPRQARTADFIRTLGSAEAAARSV